MFLYSQNTVTNTLLSGVEPWEFQPTEKITAQIRGVKEDRQAWYQNPDTKHYFYTGIEPLNPNLRTSKDNNPPRLIKAVHPDYDIKCPRETILKAIQSMKYKPTWLEESLGGNFRLIWTFEEPIRVHDFACCMFILQEMIPWLNLKLLPCLDEKAFENPTRLMCNGCKWENLGHPPIPAKDSHYFFFEAIKKYKFKPTESDQIPLDVVEKALKEKYPTFEWPDAFELNSQGPSHWFVPGSTSPLSAVVKSGGITCYSAHADKGFYTWGDLLGFDFVKDYLANAYTQATLDCWYDGHDYYRKIKGHYEACNENGFRLYLRVGCKLTAKPGPDGISPIDQAMLHVQEENRVKNAGSFVFQKPGLLLYQHQRRLNTYNRKPLEPMAGTQKWGPHGGFPFLSLLNDGLFAPPVCGTPERIQLPWVLAWLSYAYIAAFNWLPLPGHRIVMCGEKGSGKTLENRQVFGALLGGFVDATDYLVKGEHFNSHLMDDPLWCVDDEIPANTPGARAKIAGMFKKVTAQSGLICNEKFRKAGQVDWNGRVGMTMNMDFTSMRILTGSLDNNSLDKMCLFRCQNVPGLKFPDRLELMKILAVELPAFARWLLDWKWPDHILAVRDARFGFEAFHDSMMLERGMQTSSAAPFRELLLETLKLYFIDQPEAKEYTGNVTQIIRLICQNPLNTDLMRGHKPEQINRYLEQMQAEGLLNCTVHTAPDKTRVWTFQRFEPEASPNNQSTGVSFEPPRPIPAETK